MAGGVSPDLSQKVPSTQTWRDSNQRGEAPGNNAMKGESKHPSGVVVLRYPQAKEYRGSVLSGYKWNRLSWLENEPDFSPVGCS